MHRFILIDNKKNKWQKLLKEAISPLGELQTVTEREARKQGYTTNHDVIIVDETGVARAEELVTRFSSQLNPPLIVVISEATPRWEDALRLFKAGATDYIRKYWEKDRLAIFFRRLVAGVNTGLA